jgi:ABC-type enterobactin transport system permease subunit
MTALANSWLALMLAVGTAMVFAGYLAYRDAQRPPDAAPSHVERFAGDLEIHSNRLPAVLIALFVGMALGMLGYVAYVWLARPNI